MNVGSLKFEAFDNPQVTCLVPQADKMFRPKAEDILFA